MATLSFVAGLPKRSSISFDGAQITVGGKPVNAIGVNPATFRSWVPVRTASDQAPTLVVSAWSAGSSSLASAKLAALTAHPRNDTTS